MKTLAARCGVWLIVLVGFVLGGTMMATSARAMSSADATGPAKVYVGIYLANIQTVNLETNSFDADFYLWMRWADPALEPHKNVEIMNLFQSWSLIATPTYDEPVVEPDGMLYYVIRYQGSFNTPLHLENYPFDDQFLDIVIEDKSATASRLQFVPDDQPASMDPTMTLPGYDIGTPVLATADYTYNTNFGQRDPRPDAATYSSIVLTIPLASPVIPGIVKTFLPIALVVATAFLVFFVPLELLEARIGLVITGLLTLVAMHLGLAQNLPDVGYLMMIDVVYVLSYAFMFVTMGQVIYAASLARRGSDGAARSVNRRFAWPLAGIYLVCIAITVAYYVPR